MAVLNHSAAPVPAWPSDTHAPRRDPAALLPDPEPVRVLGTPTLDLLDPELLRELYARLVAGRRFNQQATILTKQGRLAVYPSSTGQEACQITAASVVGSPHVGVPSEPDNHPLGRPAVRRGGWQCVLC
ncbi:hypothetical protein ACFV4J_17090, partial [Streptomyces mirabilis]